MSPRRNWDSPNPLSRHTVQTLDLILPCIRRIPKMHFWIERKILLRLLLCILGLFLPPNFTLSFDYPGSEGTRFESRVRINGKYFSQLLCMNKTHTFNNIHIFWFTIHWKGLVNKSKMPSLPPGLNPLSLWYHPSTLPLYHCCLCFTSFIYNHIRVKQTLAIFFVWSSYVWG